MNEESDEAYYVFSENPQLREAYELALGKFLVAFNAIENNTSRLVWRALHAKGLASLADLLAKQRFDLRLDTLKALIADIDRLDYLDVESLKRLSEERNHLAHGHFSVDPYSGEHQIEGQKRSTAANRKALDSLNEWTQEAVRLAHTLSEAEMSFWFDYEGEIPERP